MLDDVTSTTLATALAGVSQQQRTSANNLANLETAGYQAQRVSFADSLRAAVAAGDPASAQISVTPSGDPSGTNGNNVSESAELSLEAQTNLENQSVANSLSSEFSMLSTAITG